MTSPSEPVEACVCPRNEAGDIRCHRCREYVNVRCWNCGTPRGEGPCPSLPPSPSEPVESRPDEALIEKSTDAPGTVPERFVPPGPPNPPRVALCDVQVGAWACAAGRKGHDGPHKPYREPVESREQPRETRVPKFERRSMRSDDVNGKTWVRIWDAQKAAPFDEGKIIAYSDQPTIVIERPDGSRKSWVASLPWERVKPDVQPTLSGDETAGQGRRTAGQPPPIDLPDALEGRDAWERYGHRLERRLAIERDERRIERSISSQMYEDASSSATLWLDCYDRQSAALAAAVASIRNLETLRDVHRRTIDDLISEAQTAGATIDELRAEVERLTEANRVAVDYWSFWERTEERTAEHRDHFRADLAAALAEVSRLREQGAWDGEDETPWIENAWPTAGQLLHRLRTDPDFRGRFVEAAIEYQGASERCWHGFHVERLAELESANLRLREQVETLRISEADLATESRRLREQGAVLRLWARELKQDAAERAGQSEAYVFAEGFADRLLAMTAETTPLAVREGE